jgi:hypothetical protein
MTSCCFIDKVEIRTASVRLSGRVPWRSDLLQEDPGLFQKSVVKLGEHDGKRKTNEVRYLDGRTRRHTARKLLQTCLFSVYSLIWFSGIDLAALPIRVIPENVQKIFIWHYLNCKSKEARVPTHQNACRVNFSHSTNFLISSTLYSFNIDSVVK